MCYLQNLFTFMCILYYIRKLSKLELLSKKSASLKRNQLMFCRDNMNYGVK